MEIADRVCPIAVLPLALASLRHVRSLLLDFGNRRTLQGIAEGLKVLPRYTRLTALDLQLMGAFSREATQVQHRAQAALDAALNAVASRSTPLTSLVLHCCSSPYWSSSGVVRPTPNVLRRLCSTVQQLSLMAHELTLMAWDTDSPTVSSSDSVRQTQSVRSLVLPYGSSWSHLNNDQAVATVVSALPSLTHLHAEYERKVDIVGGLLQRVCNRLVFLSCTTAQLPRFPSVAATCTSLTSLCVVDTVDRRYNRMTDGQLSDVFASLSNCTALRELTVITHTHTAFPIHTLFVAALPELTYLQVRTDDHLTHNDLQQLCNTLLTPNLTHLALAVHESYVLNTLRAMTAHPQLPQLTRCFVDSIRTIEQPNEVWLEAATSLRGELQLGAAWCEKEDDVVRWRADRVWKRSAGLPDEAEMYA